MSGFDCFPSDCLACKIYPQRVTGTVETDLTPGMPLQERTFRVMRAALRHFYLVMKEARLDACSNPLSLEVLVTLKHEQERSLANRVAPDHAGVRVETHERPRRDLPPFFANARTPVLPQKGRKGKGEKRLTRSK
jgi:hypothetical protein